MILERNNEENEDSDMTVEVPRKKSIEDYHKNTHASEYV